MSLAKLTFDVEDGDRFSVLFNPNQLSFQKSVRWRSVPRPESDTSNAQFTHGEPATLEVEFFFDTYAAGTDVREHTRKLQALTTVQGHGELHRPPLCRLSWGRFNFDNLQWVLLRLGQRFTLFLADGTPVRASLSCSFREWQSPALAARRLHLRSADLEKSYTVRRGDTLSGIAGTVYEDPTQWRPIAEANQIDDPRQLPPGLHLRIPKLAAPRPQES